MPMDGCRLKIEPTYPNAEKLMEIGGPSIEIDGEPDDLKIRNQFWSSKKGRDVIIFENGGKIYWGTTGIVHGLAFAMQTLGASDAWGIEQEHCAITTLGKMIKHRQMKRYLLTGMFLETSRRSGLTYLFRRLRPTVAINARDNRIIAALCLHPIGYYEDSWAGAMCPTDDILAHLALMRGDEAMFWRRSNQHPPHRPEAGL